MLEAVGFISFIEHPVRLLAYRTEHVSFRRFNADTGETATQE
jgi:hypothetical protein